MIKLTNIGTSIVTILERDYKFRRKLMPGQTTTVNEEVYNALVYSAGFQTFVKNGYIAVEVPANSDVEIIQPIADTIKPEELLKIFTTKDITAFAKIIPTASPAVKESIVKLAVQNHISDPAFVALIKKYCEVNILDAIVEADEI